MVEEDQAKEFKLGARIRFCAMEELEGRGHINVETAGDVVEHSGYVEDGPVPVLLRCLFLSEVYAGHLDKGLPGAFDETVGALSLVGGGDDLGLVSVDPLEALAPHEFLVKVRMESAGEVSDIRSELGEDVDDLV